MDKTITYALLQTIKRFLLSILKHRIPIEKYLFQNYLVFNFSSPFNNFSIQTFWQIGLHRAIPLRTFSRGHSVDVSVQSLKQLLCSKLSQWDSSGSGLISVIHVSLNFWTRDVSLDHRFQTAYCLLHDVWDRTVGRKHFKLCVWGGNDRVSVGLCSVIHKDHLLVGM